MNKSIKAPWTCGGCALVAIAATLGMFFCIALVGWIGFQAREGKATAEVNRQLASLRQRGAPVDSQSLDTFYKQQTTSEDSEAWCRILDYLGSKEFAGISVGVEDFDSKAAGTGPSSDGWSGESRYRELWFETADLRAEIRTLAAKKQPVRFPIAFDSAATLLPNIQNLRNAARLFNVEFAVAMADGASAKIRESIETQLQFSLVCEKEPIMISHLVCNAVKGIAMGNLKTAVEKNVLQPSDLQVMLDLLQATPSQFTNWKFIFQGERASMLPMFDKPFDQSMGPGNSPPSSSWINRASPQDKLNYLRYFDQIESSDVSTADRAIESNTAIAEKFNAERLNAGVLGTRNWIYTQALMPAPGALATAFARTDTTSDFCRLAIAIRLFQFKHGKLPDRLDQLTEFGVDESQMKPLGGKPYGYRRTGKSATLWGPMRDVMSNKNMPTSDEPPEVDIGHEDVKAEMIKQSVWQFGK